MVAPKAKRDAGWTHARKGQALARAGDSIMVRLDASHYTIIINLSLRFAPCISFCAQNYFKKYYFR